MVAQLAQEGTKLSNRPAPVEATIRRFGTADLSRHGGWIMRRIQKLRPELSDRLIGSWLTGLINSNEYLFLYQDHAVALAQVMREETMSNKPIVRERFVFCEEGHEAEGAEFYLEIMRWAKNLGCDVVFVEELTDVSHELVRSKVGRVFERTQKFARV
jgi:hypothetical protein